MSKHAISVVLLALLALLSLAAPGWAQERPWERDLALLDQVFGDMRTGGILGVEPYAADVEAALKQAPVLFPIADDAAVLTDGQGETLAALLAVTGEGKGKGDVAAFANPYPELALHLGTFYVEIGRLKDALRVLNAGLKLSPVPDLLLGETIPTLLSERGYTLAKLGRLDEALASYDTGLAVAQMTNQQRARLHRGRGFILIEKGELDDAVAAYEASLEFEPGNANALGELDYIESIR